MARVGIIGRGWGERSQAPNFRDAGLEVVAVAGRNDWRSLLERRDIDLVSVTMPPSQHVEMAIAALQAGKHVICEKPTALKASEAEQLVEAARGRPNQIAIIDHELRFLSSFRAARERIGEIGAIRYAEVRYASPSRGNMKRPWNWWSDAREGGGVWGAVGSHFVDALRYLGCEIEAVQAALATVVKERPFSVGAGAPGGPAAGETPAATLRRSVTSDDFAAVHLRLRGSVLAVMTFSAVASGPDEPTLFSIHGERGVFRLVGEELLFAEPGGSFRRIAGDDLAKRIGNSPGGAFGSGTYYLGVALRRALDDGHRDALASAATFEDGLAQQRVLDAARRSHATGGRWEPVTSS